jgi:hypothetical protein
MPTGVRRPREKAKVEVEVAVQIIERFVLANLRNPRFFLLAELNVAVFTCVADINVKTSR